MAELRRRRRGGRAPRDEGEARMEATRAIGYALKNLKVLRTLYIIDAAVMALVFLLARGAGADTLAFIAGGCALLAGLGAAFVIQQPLVWSLVLAIAHSVPAVFAIWVAQLGFVNINSILTVLLAVLLWCTVSMAIRTGRLLEQYPDVWAARRMKGEGRAEHAMGSKHRDAARARARRRNLTIAAVVGAIVLAIALAVSLSGRDAEGPGGGGGQAKAKAKPTESVHARAAEFAEAWGVGGMAGISPFLADSERARIARGLGKMIRRHGWEREAFPAATGLRVEPYDDWHAYAHFDVADYGTMRTSWEWEEDRWVLVRVRFKRAG